MSLTSPGEVDKVLDFHAVPDPTLSAKQNARRNSKHQYFFEVAQNKKVMKLRLSAVEDPPWTQIFAPGEEQQQQWGRNYLTVDIFRRYFEFDSKALGTVFKHVGFDSEDEKAKAEDVEQEEEDEENYEDGEEGDEKDGDKNMGGGKQ